jgi:hypothetical protein
MEDLNCPHCGTHLTTIETPVYSKWGGIELELCLNDQCVYFLRSWKVLAHQAGALIGYRYYHDSNGGEGPMAVGSIEAYKDCVITEEEKKSRLERAYREEKEFRDLLDAIEQAKEKDDQQLVVWLRQLRKLKYPNRS